MTALEDTDGYVAKRTGATKAAVKAASKAVGPSRKAIVKALKK